MKSAAFKTLSLAWTYLWSRPLGAALNLLLLSLGLASISFLLLVSDQLSKAFERDLRGIDLVVGAKGSPMQLILSGVFHVDVPPGNVPLKAVQDLQKNPLVAQLIPISLGDSLRGFRIVGTSLDYISLYRAELAQGQLWTKPMQAVLGAAAARQLGLKLGDRFAGSHGLAGGGHVHEDNSYQVIGILAASGSVLDRLILTDTASVWQVHEDAHAPEVMTPHDADDEHAAVPERQVTLALITYKSPLAAVSLPRFVNSSTGMQAAAPAMEITRLLGMLGIGTEVLRAFAGVLLLTAGLSLFIALWGALRERRGDLALLRMLGASPMKLSALLLLEALWLGLVATVLGVVAGQGLTAGLAWLLELDNSLLIAGMSWPTALWSVPAIALSVSLAAAALPAWAAYRVSVLELLQGK